MKKIINRILELGKNIFKKYPITIVTALILTILLTIFVGDIEDIIANIMICLGIFDISSFLIESLVKKKNILFISASIISIALMVLHNIDSVINYTNRIIICYVLSIFIIGLYINYKNSKQELSRYMINIIINLFKVEIIYGILITGISMILGIFTSLIYDFVTFDIIERIVILISGVYLIPSVLYSLNTYDYEPPKYSKVVIKNILHTLVIFAFIIIYLYIFKIIFLKDIPSNEVFRIITTLFVIGLPIWTMASYFKDNNILDKINNILPYLFIPFILLQIYALGVRIINNGITPTRYIGIMLIIYELIYIIIYFKNKKHIDKIIPILVILIVISSIVPFINMYKISILSQYHNLKIYKKKDELTDDDKDKIKGAYYYLIDEDKELVNKLLTEDEIDEIKTYNNYNNQRTYKTAYFSLDTVDIKGYNKLTKLESSNGKINLEKVTMHNNDTIIEIDLSDIINENTLDNLQNYLENHNEIILDNNTKLILTYVHIGYYSDMDISYIALEGYLLEK